MQPPHLTRPSGPNSYTAQSIIVQYLKVGLFINILFHMSFLFVCVTSTGKIKQEHHMVNPLKHYTSRYLKPQAAGEIILKFWDRMNK